MKKPPVCLFIPSYVVAYAENDERVCFTDWRNLKVGGEWVGEVPALAICRNVETQRFHLAHCSEAWECLCLEQTAPTIAEAKIIAERHYEGIAANWIETGYTEEEALPVIAQGRESMKCSFCGNSHFDEGVTGMVTGANARICNQCVLAFAREFEA